MARACVLLAILSALIVLCSSQNATNTTTAATPTAATTNADSAFKNKVLEAIKSIPLGFTNFCKSSAEAAQTFLNTWFSTTSSTVTTTTTTTGK